MLEDKERIGGNGSGRRERCGANDKSGVVHSCFIKGVIFVKEGEGLGCGGGRGSFVVVVVNGNG